MTSIFAEQPIRRGIEREPVIQYPGPIYFAFVARKAKSRDSAQVASGHALLPSVPLTELSLNRAC
jgi:hypothetical protein